MHNRDLYPVDWEDTSIQIRAYRALWCCEWCHAEQSKPHPITGSMVVLTVAHLGIDYPDGRPGDKTDKSDCRPENLAALCQRCHLNFDRNEIQATQLQNRIAKMKEKRADAHQLPLFGPGDN